MILEIAKNGKDILEGLELFALPAQLFKITYLKYIQINM